MRRLIPGALLALVLAAGLTVPTASAAGKSRVNYQQLISATKDFGYWMTYSAHYSTTPPSRLASPAVVNRNIARHISLRNRYTTNSGSIVGLLTGRMHLMNTPSGYRFHVDSYSDERAVETFHWLFGRNPHTPIVRVVWTMSPIGWSITRATFVRNS